MEYEKLITRLRHIYADGDPITEEAADCIEQLSGITEQLRQRVAELEKFHELDTKQIAYLFEERNLLIAERDSAYKIADHYRAERDTLMKNGERRVEETERRVSACVNACAGISTENLEDNKPLIELAMAYNVALRQRDELLAAAEAIEINAEECLDFDECTAMLVQIDDYHKLMEAIANVKGKA